MRCPHCDSRCVRFAGETTGSPAYWCEQCGTLFYQWQGEAKPDEVYVPLDATGNDGG